MNRKFLLVLFILLFPIPAGAEVVYVQSAKVRIMSEPNFKSSEIATASRGDKLTVVEKGAGWVKVTAAKGAGWVNQLTVSNDPPMEKVNIITADASNLEEKARKRSSAMTSAAAARGLSDQERKRLSDLGAADYRALINLERSTSHITDQDVENFQSSGK